MHPLAQAASRLLARPVLGATRMRGGDLNTVFRLRLPDGATLVAKTGPAPRVEAKMLRAIAGTGCPAPSVVAVDDTLLLLEDMPDSGALSPTSWEALGHHLNTLHQDTGPRYGWASDYAFGEVPIANGWHSIWTDFWSENRLLPSLPYLPSQLRQKLEHLAARLSDWLPTDPPASLLHGDLWGGNILASDGLTGLIDPACYYGHGEVDLAMLCLFDHPHEAFWAGYGRPEGDWPRRRALYQLWPALVHLRLFGRSYLPMVERCMERALR